MSMVFGLVFTFVYQFETMGNIGGKLISGLIKARGRPPRRPWYGDFKIISALSHTT